MDYKLLQNILSGKNIPFNTVFLKGDLISIFSHIEIYDSSLGLMAAKMILQDIFANYPVKITSNLNRQAILIEIEK